MPKRLTKTQEMMFQKWYTGIARKMDLNPDPDDPMHKYDYRGAWLEGFKPGEDGHWPSKFKADDHPNRFISFMGQILDTKYDKIVPMKKYLFK